MPVTTTYTAGISTGIVVTDGDDSIHIPGTVLIDPTTGLPYAAGGGGGGGGDASAANQVITNDQLGATNEAAAGTDTATSGLNGLFKRLLQRLTTLLVQGAGAAAAALRVTIAADDAQIGAKTTASTVSAGGSGLLGWASDAVTQLKAMVAGVVLVSTGYRSAVVTTRPANTTAYTAGDVVGGVITFTNIGPSGGHIMLTSVDLRYDVAAIPSGMTSFRLQLYTATPPSALADNAAWDLPSGDRDAYIGFIDLGSPVDVGSTLFVQLDGLNKQVKLATGETSLYAYQVTLAGYTPAANSETFRNALRALAI